MESRLTPGLFPPLRPAAWLDAAGAHSQEAGYRKKPQDVPAAFHGISITRILSNKSAIWCRLLNFLLQLSFLPDVIPAFYLPYHEY